MNFFIVNSDDIKVKRKRSICYNENNSNLFYIDTKLNVFNISNYRFINEDEVNNINLPFILYVVKHEKSCKLYNYVKELNKVVEVTDQSHIMSIINCPYNVSQIGILENKGESFAPLTTSASIKSIDGIKNVDQILENPINKNIGKYEIKIGYIEILDPAIRVYSMPAPIPNLTIKKTSMFVMFIGDEMIHSQDFTILDNDYQIEFSENVELVHGMKITVLMGFHVAVDLTNIVVEKGNLSDTMAVEWESFERHKKDYSNPHRVSKTQIGLSNVQNYPIASTTDVEEGTNDNTYMTPNKTRQMILSMMADGYIEYSSYLIREKKWVYTYTNSSVTQYEIPSTYYDPSIDRLEIHMYGLRLEPDVDYRISGRTVTLLNKVELNSPLVHRSTTIVPNEHERTPVYTLKHTHKWVAGEDNNDSFTIPPTIFTSSCRAELYLEGVRMNEGDDYEISHNLVELRNPVKPGMSITTYIYGTELNWSDIRNTPRPIDNLESDSTTDYLSARQGKVLSRMVGSTLQSYRIPGNTETIIEDGDTTTYKITDSNGVMVAMEEIVRHDEHNSTSTLTLTDQTRRTKNIFTTKVYKNGNTTVKEYM